MSPLRTNLSASVPPKFTQRAAVICALIGGYLWFTYSGPYRWLAEWQLRTFSVYYASYTWAATVVLLMIAAVAAFQVSRKLGLVAGGSVASEESRAQSAEVAARWARQRPAIVVLTLGGTLLFIGGRDWMRAQGGRELEHVLVSFLEGGHKPSSTWIEVAGGTLAWDAATEWKRNNSTVTYVPLFSPAWTEGNAVGAILKLNSSEVARARGDVHSFKGVSDEMGLPGPVSAAYEDHGLAVKNALVLQVGNDPPSVNEPAAACSRGLASGSCSPDSRSASGSFGASDWPNDQFRSWKDRWRPSRAFFEPESCSSP